MVKGLWNQFGNKAMSNHFLTEWILEGHFELHFSVFLSTKEQN